MLPISPHCLTSHPTDIYIKGIVFDTFMLGFFLFSQISSLVTLTPNALTTKNDLGCFWGKTKEQMVVKMLPGWNFAKACTDDVVGKMLQRFSKVIIARPPSGSYLLLKQGNI